MHFRGLSTSRTFTFTMSPVDRAGRHHLAEGIDDRDLHAGPVARIEPERWPRACRGREQEVTQVGGEDADRLFLGRRP